MLVYENGQHMGLKVFGVKDGSILSQLGLRNRDIIRRVNDQTPQSGDEALSLMDQLKDAPEIRVTLVRDGTQRTIVYHVQ